MDAINRDRHSSLVILTGSQKRLDSFDRLSQQSLFPLCGIQPHDFRVATEPGHLPLGITPALYLCLFFCMVQADFAREEAGNLPIADRLKGVPLRGEPFEQPSDFIDESRLEHFLHPGFNSAVQLLTRPVNPEFQPTEAFQPVPWLAVPPVPCPPCEHVNFVHAVMSRRI